MIRSIMDGVAISIVEESKILRGHASQYYVAAELCRRGIVAAVTMGGCPTTDILCTRLDGEGYAHLQVKTFRKGGSSCSVGLKAEKNHGDNFFWVLVGLPLNNNSSPDFYIIPSDEMQTHIKKCFELWAAQPGRDGGTHDMNNSIRSVRVGSENRDGWEIQQYKNGWERIAKKLNLKLQTEALVDEEENDEDSDASS